MKKLGHEIGLPLGGKNLIDIIKDRAKRIDFPWSRNKTKPEVAPGVIPEVAPGPDYDYRSYEGESVHRPVLGNTGSIMEGDHYEVELDGIMTKFPWGQGPLADTFGLHEMLEDPNAVSPMNQGQPSNFEVFKHLVERQLFRDEGLPSSYDQTTDYSGETSEEDKPLMDITW